MKKFLACWCFMLFAVVLVGNGFVSYNWNEIFPKAGEGFQMYYVFSNIIALVGLIIGGIVLIATDD